MCGIVGTNFLSNNFNNAVNSISHRGVNFQDTVTYKDNQFGHTRLSIIDLDIEANQPMEFDGVIITFNGEIYNYKKLIQEHNLKVVTKSDTEVLIRLYQKYEFDFLHYLNGMFSFTIYDMKKDIFYCARDRFGKKPFFYHFSDSKFVYASEIKSILKILDIKPNINNSAFLEYLRFSSPIYDNTIYDSIKKLPAGYRIILENNDMEIQKWYDIDKFGIEIFDERKALNDIEELLFDSVGLRIKADVEVASFLSGGLDSSFVSALYSKIANKKINTYSIGYDEYLHYSELDYAKKVSKYIDSNHTEIIMSKKDFIETIDKVLDATDEPFGDSATIPTYILSQKVASDGIKVALSGEGSDEVFLGYDNYFKIFEYYKKTFSKRDFDLTKEWEYENRRILNQSVFYSSGEVFTEEQKKRLLNNYCNIELPYKNNYSYIRNAQCSDFKYWIENVLMTKIDRASMAHSLEVRAPFLDFNLVEYLFKVDDKLKSGNTNKYLLKKIANKYLSQEIVHRRKKGFSSPFIEWIFDEYKDNLLHDILEVNKITNYFNEDFVRFLYNEAKYGRFKQHFYNVYIFSRWFKRMYL